MTLPTNAEFESFLTTKPLQPPQKISQLILGHIQADLNPSPFLVFSKSALIHALAGSVTLLFCPQFSVGLPTHAHGLMVFLMRYGETACMLGCGAFFLGAGALFTSLWLKPEEIRQLRKHPVLQFSGVVLVLIAALICAGATVVFGNLLAFWLLGAFVGGKGALELGWWLRRKLAK